jgi:hypothetical protein
MMLEIIMVAQQQIFVPFSKEVLIILFRQQDQRVPHCPLLRYIHGEERKSEAQHSNHMKQVK